MKGWISQSRLASLAAVSRLALLALASASIFGCDSSRAACAQRKECLSGLDACRNCATDNYVEVCAAAEEADLIPYTSCDDDKCREAADFIDAYNDCRSAAECTEWLRSEDDKQDFTLCEAERNRMSDARKACREAKQNSCTF
ncbi:MAG: hypothetical protein HY791_04080 [Deltaproteobacteria bacterium]|nr:hypothetical protein [Deltaproteobacteria bacterium]